MTDTAINRAIADIKLQQRQLEDNAAKLRKHKRLINRVLAKLKPSHEAGVLAYEPHVGPGHAGASVTATIYDAEGFKHPTIVALLEKFTDADSCSTSDWPNSINRDFLFTYIGEDGYDINVRIQVYVRADSPTCKKVSKGVTTKVVEEEQFEIVCN